MQATTFISTPVPMQQTILTVCVIILSLFISCQRESDRDFAGRLAQESTGYIGRNRLDSAMLVNFRILERIDTADNGNYDIIASTYNNLGDIFYKASIFDKALHMYERSLAYGGRLADKTEESHARRGLWRCAHSLNLPQKDTALTTFRELLPHIKSIKEISSLYNNVTGYFMYNGMPDSAFVYNKIAIGHSNDSITLYRNWSIRSELFINKGTYDSARHYALLAANSPDIYTKTAAIYRLSKIAEKENDDSSIVYLKQYSALIDSVYNMSTADSIKTVLYRKQLSAAQDAATRNSTIIALLALVFLATAAGVVVFLVKARRKSHRMQDEAERLKQKLSELNATIVANNKKAGELEQYSEQYRSLLLKQKLMEETFVTQLVAAHEKCIAAFRKSSFYNKLPAIIDGGNGILSVDRRQEMQRAINKDFLPLRHSLATYFDISDEDFYLYCLSAAGFSTKDCAACRGVSPSAIRMQRMRMNNKIKSFFSSDINLDKILL